MKYLDLIEKRRHGTPEFPVEYYRLDIDHPRYVMQPHWHKEFEIIRVLSGQLTVYLNNQKYLLSQGECLFVEGGCLKRGYPEDCVYECLVFDTVLLERGLRNGEGRGFHISELTFKNYVEPNDKTILSEIDKVFSAIRDGKPYYQILVTATLYKIFYELFSLGYIEKRKESDGDKGVKNIISILKWIENHIAEAITLARISEEVGLSEKYVCRIFKEYTSKTIMDYVNETRVEISCRELVNHSVTEVAFSVGFNDLSYFSKTFKKYTGISPSEYKKSFEKKENPAQAGF